MYSSVVLKIIQVLDYAGLHRIQENCHLQLLLPTSIEVLCHTTFIQPDALKNEVLLRGIDNNIMCTCPQDPSTCKLCLILLNSERHIEK